MTKRSKLDAEIWDKSAQNYIEYNAKEKNKYLSHLIYESLFDNILNLSGVVKGKKILDAGCGEGRMARILASRGGLVYACDASKTMIEEAQKIESYKGQNIKYSVNDLTEPLSLQTDFDLIIANLVFFNIYDLGLVLRNLAISIKSKGILIFSLIHPCFNSNNNQRMALKSLGRTGGQVVFSIKKSYKNPTSYKADYKFKHDTINFYHRPLETYFEQLSRNGFYTDKLLEPVLNLNEIIDENKYHQHFFPRFVIIRSTKIS